LNRSFLLAKLSRTVRSPRSFPSWKGITIIGRLGISYAEL
jgi:hypothetical protein